MVKNNYQFTSNVWEYSGKGAWIFVTVPQNVSSEIRNSFKEYEEGWGRLKIDAKIGKTNWKTAIWFDSKNQTYLLPLKSEIRKKEKILLNSEIEVIISI